MRNPDILYYDGSCPLCRREMSHLQKLKSEALVLQDIHQLPAACDSPDPSGLPEKEALLKSLHLRRGDRWVIGLDANIAAWQYTRIGLLWRWLSLPGVKPIANWCYQLWASRRFAKRYPNGCSEPGEA